MASAQQNDMEVSGDWTLVSSPGGDKMIAATSLSQHEGNRVEEITEDENSRNTVREVELASLEPENAVPEKDEGNDRDHNRDSDIDILDEDVDESLESSAAAPPTSTSLSFSEISAANTASSYENLEVLPDDDAASAILSDASIPPGLDLRPGVRRYKHVPNAKLNITLSVMAALVAAAALGLGIGHYLGWSDKFFEQKEMTQAQIGKLRQLQDELIICMQQQKKNKESSSPDKDPLICYEDHEYWKQKFENLFRENKGLKELLEQTQSNAVLADARVDVSEEGQCEGDDLHKLKLDLILNQMQHLQLMKTFNEVKHQERQTRERARILEEENKELKLRLVEEEEEDKALSSLEEKIESLKEENAELKAHLKEDTSRQETLLGLEGQVQLLQLENEQLERTLKEIQHNEEEEQQTITARLSHLKDKVNQLANENEDLKAIVAKLRYGQPPPASDHDDERELHRQKISDLRRENGNLEVEIEKKRNVHSEATDADDSNQDFKFLLELLKSQHMEAKHWRKLYEDLQTKGTSWSNLSTVNWTELLNNGTEAASNAVSVMLDRLKKMSLGTKVSEKISQVKHSFSSLRNIIAERWERLQQSMNSPERNGNVEMEDKSRIVANMARAVENSLKKVYDASNKFLSVLDRSVETKATKLTSKLWRAMDTLNKKLYQMAHEKQTMTGDANVDVVSEDVPGEDKSHRDEYNKASEDFVNDHQDEHMLSETKPMEEVAEEEEEEEVPGEDGGDYSTEIASDWFTVRARSRAEQRFTEEVRNDNWFLRRQRSNWRNTKKSSRGGKNQKAGAFSSDDEDEAYFRSRRR